MTYIIREGLGMNSKDITCSTPEEVWKEMDKFEMPIVMEYRDGALRKCFEFTRP